MNRIQPLGIKGRFSIESPVLSNDHDSKLLLLEPNLPVYFNASGFPTVPWRGISPIPWSSSPVNLSENAL